MFSCSAQSLLRAGSKVGVRSPPPPPRVQGPMPEGARTQVRRGPHTSNNNSSAHLSLRCTPLSAITCGTVLKQHANRRLHPGRGCTVGKEQEPGARGARVQV